MTPQYNAHCQKSNAYADCYLTSKPQSPDSGKTEAGVGADALDEAGGFACAAARGEVVFGFAARFFEDLQVADEVADAECGDAGLSRAHDFAGAA